MRNKFQVAIVILAALISAAGCKPRPRDMTPEEPHRMQAITAKLVPRCVGRYLIDLPEVFELNSVHLNKIEDVAISIKPMTQSMFELDLKRRVQELEGSTLMGKPTRSLIDSRALVGGLGRLFDRSEDDTGLLLRVWELVAWKNGFKIEMLIKHRDAAYADPPGRGKTTGPERLAHLFNVFSRTRPRADHDIPQEQGVCFANGFVAGPPTEEEDVVVRYTVKDAEDGQFVFHAMSSIGADTTTLLDRKSAVQQDLQRRHGRLIRSGKVAVRDPSLDVEEILRFVPHEQTKIDTYAFVAEMNSKQGNAQAPFFGIDFGSGYGRSRPPESLDAMASRPPLQKAIFNEAESIAVWDAALPTLRKRPGAF